MKPITERREDKQPTEVEVIKIGGSLYRRIPTRQVRYLDINQNTTLHTQQEKSDRYGRYRSIWNPVQQGNDPDKATDAEPIDVLKNGDSYYLRIIPGQRDHLDTAEGTTLKTQLEYNEENGRYITDWNPTHQTEGDGR